MKCLLLLTLLGLAAGCGTTSIITPDRHARIWVDGAYVGQGQAEVRKRGTPGSATVLVKTDDGRTAQSTLKRSFTFTTALLGLYTYGICMFACWEYPETLFVFLDAASSNDPRGVDPWTQAPPGWVELPSNLSSRAEAR